MSDWNPDQQAPAIQPLVFKTMRLSPYDPRDHGDIHLLFHFEILCQTLSPESLLLLLLLLLLLHFPFSPECGWPRCKIPLVMIGTPARSASEVTPRPPCPEAAASACCSDNNRNIRKYNTNNNTTESNCNSIVIVMVIVILTMKVIVIVVILIG